MRSSYIIVVVIVILFASTRVFSISLSHIFALILSIYCISQLNNDDDQKKTAYDDLDYRNEQIGSPSNFYMDANFINYFYNIFMWRALNSDNFDTAIAAVNNILKIEKDSEISNDIQEYDIAYQMAKLAVTMIHGIVYSFKVPKETENLDISLVKLQKLLLKHLEIIKTNYENNNDLVNVNTKYIDDISLPDPFSFDD